MTRRSYMRQGVCQYRGTSASNGLILHPDECGRGLIYLDLVGCGWFFERACGGALKQ